MTLDFAVEAGAFSGEVLDVSEKALRVRVDQWDSAPAKKTAVFDAALRTEESEPLVLPSMSVRRIATPKGGGLIVTLATDDAATAALLWQTVERFTSERKLPNQDRALVSPESLVKIPARGQYSEAARQERLGWLEGVTGTSLVALKKTRVEPERLTSNIENMIGTVEVPVGLAGPLLFRGQHAQGTVYGPLGTTEGTLVASCSRGATAMSRSGGVTTRVIGQRMMRVPLFVLTNMEGAFMFANWVRDHIDDLRVQVGLVSRHARLVSVEPVLIGKMVHVYFTYETGDAAGQNMTTACTWQACQWIMSQTKYLTNVEFENFIIEANMSSDKKVTLQSFIAGRGIRVAAECLLTGDVLRKVLKVTPEQLAQSNAGFVAGSIHVGMVGYNIDVANIIAAIYTATGQDIACVHESSVAQLHLQQVEDGIHASLVLPSLIIGTVGGGTHLPGQQAMLEMIDCAGPGKVFRFAEIIAGFCLALDLSTLSAICTGEFASAHERLGRNRPVDWFGREDLGLDFFEPALRESLGDNSLKVRNVLPAEIEMGSSIITELTARKVDKLVGHIPLRLVYKTDSGDGMVDVVVKVKPSDEEVILMINGLAAMCGPLLTTSHNRFKRRTGMANCHVRELGVYDQTDERFTRNVPKIYRTYRSDEREAYVVVMEKLQHMVLMDTADEVRGWTRRNVEIALEGIAEVHSIWLGREDELQAKEWLGEVPSAAGMEEMKELWRALAEHAHEEFPELVSRQRREHLRRYIRNVGDWWSEIEAMPRTLIHNDFNPRNVALRDDDNERRLCAYDWELATLHLPQHDVAEFMCFVLREGVKKRNVDRLLDSHLKALEAASGQTLDKVAWRQGYRLALMDLAINRFGLYLMAHTFRHYGFMERTINSLWWLLELEGLTETS